MDVQRPISRRRRTSRPKAVRRLFRGSTTVRGATLTSNAANRKNTISTFSIGGFPKQSTVRLVYVDEVLITPSVLGGISSYFDFSANGCFDPNISGTGHQPIGFDQWMGVYNHYCVNWSKIKVRAAYTNTTNPTPPDYCGVACSPTTAQFSGQTLTRCVETTRQLDGMHGLINNLNYPNSPDRGVLTAFYSKKKMFGDKGLSDADLRGTSSSNPSEDAIFSVWAVGMAGTAAAAFNAIVEIEYDVTFYENKLMPQS